jgi:uncharacterized protein (DUF2236 family)
MPDSSTPVSLNDIEALWNSVRGSTPNPCEGLFGPSSLSWRINRESALFLGAGRASLLQLAHPWVAASLDQHSNLRTDPLGRFHKTFRLIFAMVFGTLDQALAASRYLYRLHTRIRGELPTAIARYPQGSRYEANEANALLWVYATLIDSALLAHDFVLPPLSAAERQSYYDEGRRMAALFGIPPFMLPPGWPAFQAYIRDMLSSTDLGVDALSRELAHRVLHGRGSWVPVPGWYRALTASWLPERLRSEFALGFGPREQRAVARAARWLPPFYRHLPAPLRFVGPYHEASARLAGRAVTPLTTLSNRFWMGQPRMMFTDTPSPSA